MAIADKFSRITNAGEQCVGVIWKPREAHLKKLTLDEIRKKCGTPSHSYGPKEEMWGRVGFISKDGHSDFVFQVVPSISNLNKPEK